MAHIFVSYTSSDREWAFWIGQVLKELGHVPYIHEWEIPRGGNIGAWMENRLDIADHALFVVSKAYLTADYSSWERQAAQWATANNRHNFSLPIFVEKCEAPLLLAPFKRCELYGLAEEEARVRLVAYMADPQPRAGSPFGNNAPPTGSVPFPGTAQSS